MSAYKKILRFSVLAIAIQHSAAFAESALANAETLATPQQDRITDVVINRDLNTFKEAQNRIAKLNNTGVDADNYFLVKAQAWLDFATQEYYVNDRSLAIEHALAESYALIKEMEAANPNISMDTVLIPESQRLREDLWKLAAELKQHQGFKCAAANIAELEVRLVWAGHEHQELGWRHAREHFAAAERLAKMAQKRAENCVMPPKEDKQCPVLVCPTIAEAAPTNVEPKAVVTPETPDVPLVNVPRNVHFALDKSAINAKAAVVLHKVVQILKAYPHMNIRLVGHTDTRASKTYNQALSERRAKSVLMYLMQHGVESNRMGLRGEGFNDIKTNDNVLVGHALSRRVEIEYFGETIESYEQSDDLMLEEGYNTEATAKKATQKRQLPKK